MPNPDNQPGFYDTMVDDPELAAALDTLDETRQANTERNAARRIVKQRIAALVERQDVEIKDGDRIRCGDWIFTYVIRGGGPIDIPEWESPGIANVDAADG